MGLGSERVRVQERESLGVVELSGLLPGLVLARDEFIECEMQMECIGWSGQRLLLLAVVVLFSPTDVPFIPSQVIPGHPRPTKYDICTLKHWEMGGSRYHTSTRGKLTSPIHPPCSFLFALVCRNR